MGSIPSCSKCGIVIKDTKALQCDHYQQDNWKCAECLNLPPDIYDQLLSDAGTNCNLRWFCDDCDKAVMDTTNKSDPKGDKIECLIGLVEKLMDKFDSIDDRLRDKCDVSRVVQVESRIRVLEDRFAAHEQGLNHKIMTLEAGVALHEDRLQRIKELEDRFAAYEQGLNHKIMTLEAGVALHEDRLEQLDKDKDKQPTTDTMEVRRVVVEQVAKSFEELEEEKDVEGRKTNIILYRVPEDRTDDFTTRNNKDKAFVTDLLDCVFDTKCQQGDIAKLYRLGRWSPDGSVARPLLVGFSQIDMKIKVMSNLRLLKEADQRFKGVNISNDLTPKQREEIKKLVADAKKEHLENSTEDEENFRFLVVGQGHRKRVTKVRKN